MSCKSHNLLPDLENCQCCDKSHFFSVSLVLIVLKAFESTKRYAWNRIQAQHNQVVCTSAGSGLFKTCV